MGLYIGLAVVLVLVIGFVVFRKRPEAEPQITIEEEVEIVQAAEEKFDESEVGKLNLSIREYEVLMALVKGYTNADIANELLLSPSQVKNHISNIYTKMEVSNRPQAIEKAKRLRMTL